MTETQSVCGTEQLAALDFTPSCCCEASFCGTHPHRVECGEEADMILTFHQVGMCDGRHPSVNVDEHGNEVGAICKPCLDRIVGRITAMVERGRTLAGLLGFFTPMCPSCGTPIFEVSDVIRDIRPIR